MFAYCEETDLARKIENKVQDMSAVEDHVRMSKLRIFQRKFSEGFGAWGQGRQRVLLSRKY